MRLRDLETWLLAHGWRLVRERPPTVTWEHQATGRRLNYHRPHGGEARELSPGLARAIVKRAEMGSELESEAR